MDILSLPSFALVASQHIAFALSLEARSRANRVLVGAMFLGGTMRSAAATLACRLAVSMLGGLLAVLATVLQLGRRAK